MSLLTATSVTKSFATPKGPLTVLRGVSLSVEKNEFVAIQGASGSGKSTLLSVLAGLDRPTAGTVALDGETLGDLSESGVARVRRDKIGFVFQSFHLVASLTVEENVGLPAAFRGRSQDPGAVGDLLNRLGLANRAGFFPDQLSGGEKQRVALARALIHGPAIVFADEPTGNLDSKNGETVLSLLEEHTRGAGRALVLVTHDDGIAARADRRLRLVDGAWA